MQATGLILADVFKTSHEAVPQELQSPLERIETRTL